MTAAPSVPRTLLRLKLRLLRNRARAGGSARTQLVVGTVAAVVFGLLGAVVAAALGHDDDPRLVRGTLVLGATALAVGWTILPLISFGSDESLDPARLQLLPLTGRPLLRGLLLASFVGPAPTAVLLTMAGAVVGFAGVSWLIVPAVVLVLLFSVALARTVSTVLGAALSSRRGRDTTIVIVSLLLLSVQALRFVKLTFLGPEQVEHISDVARWVPPGMAGQAVVDAGDGRLALGLLELVPVAALIPALVWLWGRALERALTTVEVATRPAARRRAGGEALPLLFRRLPFVRPTPWGAVAAKELRYVGREPRHKVALANTVIIGAGFPVFLAINAGGDLSRRAVLVASVISYLVLLAANNQFGVDGAAIWLDLAAGNTLRHVLMGKNLALTLEVLPVAVVVGTGVAALSGGWTYLPGALVLAIAALGAGLGVANVVSVRFPIPLPETGNPFGGAGGGQGCATGGIVIACLVVQQLLLLPVAVVGLIGTLNGPGWLLPLSLLTAAYGAGLWWWSLDLAEDYGRHHEPERLLAVDPARSA